MLHQDVIELNSVKAIVIKAMPNPWLTEPNNLSQIPECQGPAATSLFTSTPPQAVVPKANLGSGHGQALAAPDYSSTFAGHSYIIVSTKPDSSEVTGCMYGCCIRKSEHWARF